MTGGHENPGVRYKAEEAPFSPSRQNHGSDEKSGPKATGGGKLEEIFFDSGNPSKTETRSHPKLAGEVRNCEGEEDGDSVATSLKQRNHGKGGDRQAARSPLERTKIPSALGRRHHHHHHQQLTPHTE
jgi:hypothetical protein